MVTLIVVLVAGWLLLGEPWYAERRKRRLEEEIRRFHRDVDLAVAYATGGRAGLERVLVGDLKQLVVQRALQEGITDIDMILELMR